MTRRHTRGPVVGLVVGLLLALGLHSRPDVATFSLVKIETAHSVDFDQEVVWLLLLGSDADAGKDILKGRADGIQLVGIDFDTGTAVAFGVPRDSWVDLEGFGMDRINAGLAKGGPELMASTVEDLFGIAPDYVVTIGIDGLSQLVDTVGGIRIDAAQPISDPEHDLDIHKGRNELDGAHAAEYPRARYPLPRGDYDRSSNHQEMMRGVVRQLADHQHEIGFLEAGVLAALGILDTDLSATELYRLTQAVGEVDLTQVSTCVLSGTPGTAATGASIIYVDSAQARRLGTDTRDDAHLDATCRG
jgi:LCP family protein required for cell wall assembly